MPILKVRAEHLHNEHHLFPFFEHLYRNVGNLTLPMYLCVFKCGKYLKNIESLVLSTSQIGPPDISGPIKV